MLLARQPRGELVAVLEGSLLRFREMQKQHMEGKAGASFDEWLEMYRLDRGYTSKTWLGYMSKYNRWKAYCAFAGLDPRDMAPDHLERFLDGVPGKLSNVRNYVTAIKSLLVWVQDLNHEVYRGALAFLDMRYGGSFQREADRSIVNYASECDYSDGQMRALLTVWDDDDSWEGLRNAALVRLLVYTGMRRAELVDLRWEDWREADDVMVARNAKGGARVAYLICDPSPRTRDALRRMRSMQAWDCGGFLFTAFSGNKPIGDKQVDKILKAACERCAERGVDMPPVSAHRLRAYFASRADEAGTERRDLQKALGHKDAATTDRYVRDQDEAKLRGRIKFPDLEAV